MSAITLGHLFHAVTKFLVGTRNLAKGGIAIGTTKSKVKTAAAVDYSIGGVLYTKAATDDLFVLSGAAFAGATRYILLGLDKDGTASATVGSATELPDVPAGVCPVGYLKVVAAVGTTFTPGTTLLDAAGVTVTYVDISVPPETLV